MDSIRPDLRDALRALRRANVPTAAGLLSLALGGPATLGRPGGRASATWSAR